MESAPSKRKQKSKVIFTSEDESTPEKSCHKKKKIPIATPPKLHSTPRKSCALVTTPTYLKSPEQDDPMSPTTLPLRRSPRTSKSLELSRSLTYPSTSRCSNNSESFVGPSMGYLEKANLNDNSNVAKSCFGQYSIMFVNSRNLKQISL